MASAGKGSGFWKPPPMSDFEREVQEQQRLLRRRKMLQQERARRRKAAASGQQQLAPPLRGPQPAPGAHNASQERLARLAGKYPRLARATLKMTAHAVINAFRVRALDRQVRQMRMVAENGRKLAELISVRAENASAAYELRWASPPCCHLAHRLTRAHPALSQHASYWGRTWRAGGSRRAPEAY